MVNCQYIYGRYSQLRGVLGLGVGVGIRFCVLGNSSMCA